ncbi:Phage Tail Collar Domain protein [anaerobic digester metagenome]
MEYYVGAIAAFAFNYAPAQFVLCNGQSLLISKQQQLYALIGKKFGGDETSFKVPDLSDAAMIPGTAYYIATDGIYPQFD